MTWLLSRDQSTGTDKKNVCLFTLTFPSTSTFTLWRLHHGGHHISGSTGKEACFLSFRLIYKSNWTVINPMHHPNFIWDLIFLLPPSPAPPLVHFHFEACCCSLVAVSGHGCRPPHAAPGADCRVTLMHAFLPSSPFSSPSFHSALRRASAAATLDRATIFWLSFDAKRKEPPPNRRARVETAAVGRSRA